MKLRTMLAASFEPRELELLPRSHDIVGDIAVVRIPEAIEHRAREIGEAIMQTNRHVKTVWLQTSPVSGDLRLRHLNWTCGEERTETTHKESGCVFRVDLATCYFSPRLSYERMRVARRVQAGEVVVNMFAGVGCFSILIAKHARAEKVYSIDMNTDAIRCAWENVRLNKVTGVVEPIEGDAKEIVETRLRNTADRVLMPLPERAYEYLDHAITALKFGGGMIHYYDFVHARKDENPVEKVAEEVSGKLSALTRGFEVSFGKVVRTVGPRWFQVVLDIEVRK